LSPTRSPATPHDAADEDDEDNEEAEGAAMAMRIDEGSDLMSQSASSHGGSSVARRTREEEDGRRRGLRGWWRWRQRLWRWPLLHLLLPSTKEKANAEALRVSEVLESLCAPLGSPRARGVHLALASCRVDFGLGLRVLGLLLVA